MLSNKTLLDGPIQAFLPATQSFKFCVSYSQTYYSCNQLLVSRTFTLVFSFLSPPPGLVFTRIADSGAFNIMTHHFSTDATTEASGPSRSTSAAPGLVNGASPVLAVAGQRVGSLGPPLPIPGESSEMAPSPWGPPSPPNQKYNPTHTLTHTHTPPFLFCFFFIAYIAI